MANPLVKGQKWQKPNSRFWFLLIIFLLSVVCRLYFSYQTPSFSDGESYFTLRQIEHIKATGMPLFNDELSFSERSLPFLPLFYYLMAFFNFFMPVVMVGKILPNILASTIVFVTYFITKEITKNIKVALLTSFISIFVPVYFSLTVNRFSPYSLLIPLFFTAIYFFIKLVRDKRYAPHFAVTVLLLSITHPSVLLLLFAFVIYLITVRTEKLVQERSEQEVILFSFLMVIWVMMITFKNAFLFHGPSLIWQNIPSLILENYFKSITVPEVISQIGIIPFFFGTYVVYKYSFREKNRNMNLLLSLVLSVTALLWLKLININLGLMFLGVTLTLLFGQYIKLFLIFIEKTKVSRFMVLIIISFLAIFIFTSVIPSFFFSYDDVGNSFSKSEIEALSWLRKNTNEDSVILSSPDVGFLVNSISERKNVLDSNYLLISNSDEVWADVVEIYSSPIETVVIDLLDKYDVDYIYFSSREKEQFSVKKLSFVSDEKCFERVFFNRVEIYRSLCTLEVDHDNGY